MDALPLVLLSNKDVYNRFKPFVKEYIVTPPVWEVYKVIDNYFTSYPSVDKVDFKELARFFWMVKGKTLKPEQRKMYEELFAECAALPPVSTPATDEMFRSFITKDYATQIVNKAVDVVADKDGDLEPITDIIKQWSKEIGTHVTREDVFSPTDLSYLDKSEKEAGLNWRLKCLRKGLGPIRKGDFLIFAARPETGKTTMMASEVANFADQLPDNRPVLWFNNEEASDKVRYRVVQAYFGVTNEELRTNKIKYNDEFKKLVGHKIMISNDDSGANTTHAISRLLEEYNPGLIVFDQLDKVRGFDKKDREDWRRLGMLYEWARDRAKEYCPVIAVSQVNGSGEGEKYIDMSKLRGTSTDKQGEADAIVTIGRENHGEDPYKRFIHIPKNKLVGGGDFDESLRHGYFECRIKPAIARYEDS
jgi:replicative DNA helicase